MLAVISFILILSFLVIIHELGHFLVAKWAKIGVDEFGLGYPPRILRLFRKWKVDFTLNLVPFGGFVRLQEEDAELGTEVKPGDYRAASVPKRLLVIMAGALVNFLFGVILFAIIFTKIGIPTELDSPRIGFVAADSPAAEAQLPLNWEIREITVDGQTYQVKIPEDVIQVVNQHLGKELSLTLVGPCQELNCEENTRQVKVYARPPEERPVDQGALGIAFEPAVYVHYPFWQMPFRGAWTGFKQALVLTELIIGALKEVFIGLVIQRQLSADLAGPVGIVHQAQSSGLFSKGVVAVLSFAAMLSINLAIMNILPIPPLDGGRAILTLGELVLSRKHLARLEYYLNYGGWILMMFLILAITARDIWRIFN